jgi:hypothetical protein
MSILIFTPTLSNRLQYAASVLLGEVEITNNREQFDAFAGVKVCYATVRAAEPSILCSGWIKDGERSAVYPAGIERIEHCAIAKQDAHIPFDVFAYSFFLLSRYEEYQDFQADYVGRFDVSNSVAAPLTPVVDRWRVELMTWLKHHFPAFHFSLPSYSASLTIDVDSAFAFRHKGVKRTLGGEAKDLVRGDLKNFFARNKTLLFGKKDPFDTYDTIEQLALEHQLPLTFFFLLGDFNAYDINLPHTSEGLRRLIRKSASKATVGIHPGVGSHTSTEQLSTEIDRLKSITGDRVIHSRQHYLKLHFPTTYSRLIACGIQHDYSMGYSGDTRFRAGTSRPFLWYDLEKDQVSQLTVHPFAAMDATLKNYLRFNKHESIERIAQLKKTIVDHHGHFCLLWHNESVADFGQWKNWSSIFPEVLKLISTAD